MQISAGILFVYKDRILLAQPTKSRGNMWGIPKGKVEAGENYAQAASRETMEEIGVYVDPNKLSECELITYIDRRTSNIYKKVYYYVYHVTDLSELGLTSIYVPKHKLGLEEISSAKFMAKDEASRVIFWRQRKVLDVLGTNEDIEEHTADTQCVA